MYKRKKQLDNYYTKLNVKLEKNNYMNESHYLDCLSTVVVGISIMVHGLYSSTLLVVFKQAIYCS